MLTPQEEATLRRLARENSPAYAPTLLPPAQAVESLDSIVSRSLSKGKMQVTSLNDDPLISSKLQAAGIRNVIPGAIYSLGVGRAFILAASPSELRDAIRRAEERNRADGIVEPRGFLVPRDVLPAAPPPRSAVVGRNFVMETDL